eukprot:PhF_6_TR22430/c0_g1_i1/m.31830
MYTSCHRRSLTPVERRRPQHHHYQSYDARQSRNIERERNCISHDKVLVQQSYRTTSRMDKEHPQGRHVQVVHANAIRTPTKRPKGIVGVLAMELVEDRYERLCNRMVELTGLITFYQRT